MQENKIFTIDDLISQRATLLLAISLPGVPSDEILIYQETIESIDLQIAARNESQKQTQYRPELSYTSLPPLSEFSKKTNARSVPMPTKPPTKPPPKSTPSRTILAGGHVEVSSPVTAEIQVCDNNRFNPSITLSWSDGYKITLDETGCSSRFRTTFRDTLSLKCVSQGRLSKMWRWNTAWRCAGFYKALCHFAKIHNVDPPTLKDLQYIRPSELHRQVFTMVAECEVLLKNS